MRAILRGWGHADARFARRQARLISIDFTSFKLISSYVERYIGNFLTDMERVTPTGRKRDKARLDYLARRAPVKFLIFSFPSIWRILA